ncbi:MAG: formate/nitrite transporter family protein [Lachnospiraceae bacterium]|nr:formate/nitrite transporter family protein [Lachnospiraceae bacterium]MBO5144463.1 formate/nitrite transporter family protein [Lachnospiraceae bacterium]
MDNAFNTPAQVLDANMKAGEAKAKLPILKCILLGIMAGAFIAFGGASSNAAVHNIANQGLSKTLAGCIFPVGLMMIVFVGGELFTGDCLMIAGVADKKFSALSMIKTLVIVFFSNMVGAVLIAALVYFSGLLDYTDGALGAFTIKVAYGKATITPFKAICSGILCNILVCMAVLMATAAKDIAGKVWAIFFPICAFVIGGWEHCVANMFYIPAGIMAGMNDTYVAKAEELYGITADQIAANLNIGGFVSNLIPVTIGNILGGMVFVALPLYAIHRSKIVNKTK